MSDPTSKRQDAPDDPWANGPEVESIWDKPFFAGARRRPSGATAVVLNGEPLPLRLEVRNHSPTGFEWGYAGSGPSQLALAMLFRGRRHSPCMARQQVCGRPTHDGTPCRNPPGCSANHAAAVSATESVAGKAARLGAVREAIAASHHSNGSGSSSAGKRECHEMLRSAPGVDPVMAVADGRSDEIPDEGWLINAHVSPAGSGVVNIYRYPSGGFETGTSHSDDYGDGYGATKIFSCLSRFGKHTLAYEELNYPHRDTDPCDRFSETTYFGSRFEGLDDRELENGGRLLSEQRPMRMGEGSLYLPMNSWSMKSEGLRSHAHVNRAVRDLDEVSDVLSHIAAGMGLGQNDVDAVVNAAHQKIEHAEQHSAIG